METVIFFAGFLGGSILTAVAFIFARKSAGEALKTVFENTATKIFEQNSEKFSSQNSEKLDEVYKRFKEKIEDFERLNQEAIKSENEKLTAFDTNIKNFITAGAEIQNKVNSFVKVMNSDNRTQGAWGEIVLEKVLEASGLRNGAEYTLQKRTAEGKPDATVYLPEDKVVYIDAKTSLASWFAYVNAQSDEERKEAEEDFKNSTKNHINGLAKRDYSSEGKSPEYVLMFIPIESCYSLMFCDNCFLWDYAWKHKVMPVSPSTLLASLKIINAFHLTDRQNKNALEISNACTVMLDRFSELASDLIGMKKSLENCLTKLQGKGNIYSQIEKIKKLGVKINKAVPEIPEEIS